jgi:SSS family solute:Na+ symporter
MKDNLIKLITSIYFLLFFMTGCNSNSGKTMIIPDSLKTQCVQILREVMLTQSQFVKVHAAEYLIWAGYPDSVRDVFLREEKLYGAECPYRIGIWRVLVQAADNRKDKDNWIDSVQNAFSDVHGKDRINAAETLAKLNVIPAPSVPGVVQNALESENTSLSLYTLWAASNSNADSLTKCRDKLFHLLISDQADSLQKMLASYILRHINDLNANEWNSVAKKAITEPDSSLAKVYMLSAAYVTVPEDSIKTQLYEKVKAQLISEDKSPRAGSRTELSAVLAEKGVPADLPVLLTMLNNRYPLEKESDNADVRSAAAYAILEIGKRMKQAL